MPVSWNQPGMVFGTELLNTNNKTPARFSLKLLVYFLLLVFEDLLSRSIHLVHSEHSLTMPVLNEESSCFHFILIDGVINYTTLYLAEFP